MHSACDTTTIGTRQTTTTTNAGPSAAVLATRSTEVDQHEGVLHYGPDAAAAQRILNSLWRTFLGHIDA